MTGPMAFPVEFLRVDSVQLSHPPGKVGLRGLDQQMVVIAHEAVGMAEPVDSLYHKAQDVKKCFVIGSVDKDFSPGVATRGYVVQGAGVFYVKGTSHVRSVSYNVLKYKT
jgi:hypothetical protein